MKIRAIEKILKNPEIIVGLTDYELEMHYNNMSLIEANIVEYKRLMEEEMRFREKPYIKTQIGFKTIKNEQ